MEMTIDEIIKKENEIATEFQKAVDTHIVDDNGVTVEEICCDDTEVIEEHLQRYKVLADYHKQIADTMRKYQKIEDLVNDCADESVDDTSCCARYIGLIEEIIYTEEQEDEKVN